MEQSTHKKSLPVWRYKGSGWLLGLSTTGTTPGFINWDEATGLVEFRDLDSTVIQSLHARDITSSYLGSDGHYTLRTATGVFRFKIRGKDAGKNFTTKLKDVVDTFILEDIGASFTDEKSAASELSQFLNSHATPGAKSLHYRRKTSLKTIVLLVIVAVAVFSTIGFMTSRS